MNKKYSSLIISTILSLLVFFCAVALKRPIQLDLVLAFISWLGFWLILSGTKKEVTEDVVQPDPTYSSYVLEIIKRADTMIKTIKSSSASIKNPNTLTRLNSVSAVAEDLLFEIKVDPEAFLLTHSFLNNNLSQIQDMICEYSSLNRFGTKSSNAQTALKTFDSTLDMVEEQFKKQREKIINRRIANLSISQEAFRASMRLEGNFQK